ncbi:hypothetical protein CPB84DRAFT_1759248 [Gymnopilus junonius]|uniref:Uncharacterized protein n=1 Tax=Gymnopilus junonius TaxID=109634 RepID=A0A9P5TUQ2_GYMJU|nr:hypothetical protein CPB84DRAFT_1759248 [Gymnopilus junonius]
MTFQLMPPLKQVTVLFGESKLQTSFKISNEISPASAEKQGMKEMRQHLDKLEASGMPHVQLDPECTDFFPGCSPNVTTIGELNGNITMIVWPAEDPTTKLTPSPVMDALSGAISELRDSVRRDQLRTIPMLRTQSPKRNPRRKIKARPNSSVFPSTSDVPPAEQAIPSANGDLAVKQPTDEFSSEAIRRRFSKLEGEVATLKGRVVVLEKENTDLRNQITVITNAVAGVRLPLLFYL